LPWAQFDDHFHDSEGALVAGVEACGLHLCATCWSAAHLTDGHLPSAIVKRLLACCQDEHGAELVARLMEAGLWEPDDNGGYWLRDFLGSNRSRAQVESDRERKKEAGRKGGQVTARRYGQRPKPKPEAETEARSETADPLDDL
jgi:general stress protein YciG